MHYRPSSSGTVRYTRETIEVIRDRDVIDVEAVPVAQTTELIRLPEEEVPFSTPSSATEKYSPLQKAYIFVNRLLGRMAVLVDILTLFVWLLVPCVVLASLFAWLASQFLDFFVG